MDCIFFYLLAPSNFSCFINYNFILKHLLETSITEFTLFDKIKQLCQRPKFSSNISSFQQRCMMISKNLSNNRAAIQPDYNVHSLNNPVLETHTKWYTILMRKGDGPTGAATNQMLQNRTDTNQPVFSSLSFQYRSKSLSEARLGETWVKHQLPLVLLGRQSTVHGVETSLRVTKACL